MTTRVAHPESIVETDWVAEHLEDDNLAVVEVDVDTMAYDQGHIPGAIGWNWTTQLNDTVTRDILSKAQVQCLMGESGIGRGTTVVLYGDNNNWFATYAFWQLRMYGHQRLKVMNGGRQKWIDEGRPTSTEAPSPEPQTYCASDPDTSIRASRDYVLEVASTQNNVGLVDVRAPDEFTGKLLAPGPPASGGLPARRAHPRRVQRPLAQGCERERRDLQVDRGAERDLRQGRQAGR